MSHSESQPRSRFLIRRRIIEALLILWVIAYFAGFFKDSPTATATTPTPVASPTSPSRTP